MTSLNSISNDNNYMSEIKSNFNIMFGSIDVPFKFLNNTSISCLCPELHYETKLEIKFLFKNKLIQVLNNLACINYQEVDNIYFTYYDKSINNNLHNLNNSNLIIEPKQNINEKEDKKIFQFTSKYRYTYLN